MDTVVAYTDEILLVLQVLKNNFLHQPPVSFLNPNTKKSSI